MPKPQPMTKPANSRLKLALAGILTVVFVVVVVIQLGGETDQGGAVPQAGAKAPTGPPADQNAARAAPRVAAKAAADAPPPPPWPTPSLEDAIQHDPFAAPAAFRAVPDTAAAKPSQDAQREAAAKRRTELDQALAKLRQEGVKAIVGSEERGNAAIVGSRVVRVGDDLNGFRVIAVEPSGVMLETPPSD